MFIGCSPQANAISDTQTPFIVRTPVFTPTPLWSYILYDGGFLSGEPCGPPCFYGIVPGITSKQEAEQILSDLEVQCPVRDNLQDTLGRDLGGWICFGQLEIRYLLETEIVNFITFHLGERRSLQEVINVLGPPDFVIILDNGLPGEPLLSGMIVYNQYQMILPLPSEQAGAVFRIEPATVIGTVIYRDETTFRESSVIFSNSSFSWTGFGEYP